MWVMTSSVFGKSDERPWPKKLLLLLPKSTLSRGGRVPRRSVSDSSDDLRGRRGGASTRVAIEPSELDRWWARLRGVATSTGVGGASRSASIRLVGISGTGEELGRATDFRLVDRGGSDDLSDVSRRLVVRGGRVASSVIDARRVGLQSAQVKIEVQASRVWHSNAGYVLGDVERRNPHLPCICTQKCGPNLD